MVSKNLQRAPEIKNIDGQLKLTGRKFSMRKVEEKGSDVNLAIHLVADASLESSSELYDRAVVVSGDTDLEGAIEMTRKKFKKPVDVIIPNLKKRRSHVRTVASKEIVLKRYLKQASGRPHIFDILQKSQFPNKVIVGKSPQDVIRRPHSYRRRSSSG